MRTDNENNKGKHAIDIAELYNRKGEVDQGPAL